MGMNKVAMLLPCLVVLGLVFAADAQAVCQIGGTCGPKNHLTWNAPTTNTDNSALVDLAGFQVLTGTAPGVATATTGVKTTDVGLAGAVPAPTPTTTASVLLSALPLVTGPVVACVKAYDSLGVLSACSNEAPFSFKAAGPGAPTGVTAGP